MGCFSKLKKDHWAAVERVHDERSKQYRGFFCVDISSVFSEELLRENKDYMKVDSSLLKEEYDKLREVLRSSCG